MAAVLMVSFFLSKDATDAKTWYWNIFAWFAGFIVYQVTVNMDSIFLGPTLLAIIISAVLAYIPILKKRFKGDSVHILKKKDQD
jgi:hypothetical protein